MDMLTDFQIFSLVFGLAILHVNWIVGYQTLKEYQQIITHYGVDYAPYGRVDNLAHDGGTVFEGVVVGVRLHCKTTRAHPFGVLGFEFAIELTGLVEIRHRVEIRRIWIDWGNCAAVVFSGTHRME